MDWITRGVLAYFKQNPEMLLDVMIALGEKLKSQPKHKKERFFAILEEGIRERVRAVEKENRLLRAKLGKLEKAFEELKRLRA